jgi:hypothetical protein
MRFDAWAAPDPLKHLYRALCLVVLLIAGQQGAVVHELGHLAAAQSADLHSSASEPTDGNCALCPLYAQVATAAFSHSFQIPLLLRAGIERVAEPPVEAIGGAVPIPRSRGPPSLS